MKCPSCNGDLEGYPNGRLDGYDYRCWNCDINYSKDEVK